eukprot:EG_transcript_12142
MIRGADFVRRCLRSIWWPFTPTTLDVGRLLSVRSNYRYFFPGPLISSSCRWVMLSSLGSSAAEVPVQPGTARRIGRPPLGQRTPSAAVLAHLIGYGIDVAKVVRRYPAIASYDVERVQRITDYLASLGVDVKRVVEFHTVLLSGKVEKFEAVVHLLQANDVHVARMLNHHPAILRYRIATIQRRMDFISSCGHSVANVVNRYPNILRLSVPDVSPELRRQSNEANEVATSPPTHMHHGAVLLSSVGLDVEWLFKRSPRVLVLSSNKLRTTLDYLQTLGVRVPTVVRQAPSVLGFRIDAIQQRVQFLSDNGLDVVHHVHGCPQLLCCSIDRKLRPILTFVVEEMGLTQLELNAGPQVWGYDLKGRLRPQPGHL